MLSPNPSVFATRLSLDRRLESFVGHTRCYGVGGGAGTRLLARVTQGAWATVNLYLTTTLRSLCSAGLVVDMNSRVLAVSRCRMVWLVLRYWAHYENNVAPWWDLMSILPQYGFMSKFNWVGRFRTLAFCSLFGVLSMWDLMSCGTKCHLVSFSPGVDF